MPTAPLLRRARGFTLIELLVVMVIIGLLASYVAPRFFDHIGVDLMGVEKGAEDTRAALDEDMGCAVGGELGEERNHGHMT